MDNQVTNNGQNDNGLNNYLVTQAVNTQSLPQDKIQGDLGLLEAYEEKSNYQTDISVGVENTELSRAMKALRLANPFKGY